MVDQGAKCVDAALATGKLYEGSGFKHLSESFNGHTVHFIGLLSDGGVHSRTDQLYGLMEGCVERGAKRIRVHLLTDGRDVPDGSSVRFVEELEGVLKGLEDKGVDAKIASGGGRMTVTMDRYEVCEVPVTDRNCQSQYQIAMIIWVSCCTSCPSSPTHPAVGPPAGPGGLSIGDIGLRVTA